MTQRSVNELTVLLPLLIQIVGLIFAVLVDSYMNGQQKRVLLSVAALAFALVVENYLEYLMCMRASLWYPRLIAAIVGYAMRPAILALFCHIVSPRRNHWRAWAMVGLNAAIHARRCFLTFALRSARTIAITEGLCAMPAGFSAPSCSPICCTSP